MRADLAEMASEYQDEAAQCLAFAAELYERADGCDDWATRGDLMRSAEAAVASWREWDRMAEEVRNRARIGHFAGEGRGSEVNDLQRRETS